MLVTLFSAAFAPDLFVDVQLVIDCQLVLQVLICLLNDSLYHLDALVQVFIAVCSDLHEEGLVLLYLLSVIDAALQRWIKQLAKSYLVLAPAASDLDLAATLLFQLLLSLASGPDNLPNVVD